jgi:hypothetical protein
MPAVALKVERVESSHENFDGVPVFYSLDGWVEPFHLLDWLDLVLNRLPIQRARIAKMPHVGCYLSMDTSSELIPNFLSLVGRETSSAPAFRKMGLHPLTL